MHLNYVTFLYCATTVALLPLLSYAAEAEQPDTVPPAVEVGRATLLLKSAGEPMGVRFAISDNPEQCVGLKPIGGVYDADGTQKLLLSFISRMVQKTNHAIGLDPQIEKQVTADAAVQIHGYSTWSSMLPGFSSASGSCGPLTVQFTPVASRKYLVEFAFVGGSCQQAVYDVTDAGERQPVADQVKLSCGRL